MQKPEARNAGEREHYAAIVTLAEGADPSDASHPAQGKALADRRFVVAGLWRRLHDADETVAGERVVHEHEVTRLEHVQRKRSAWQENGAAQRKDGQHPRKISRPSVAFAYPTRKVSLLSRKQQR